jgi:hypothetical protein
MRRPSLPLDLLSNKLGQKDPEVPGVFFFFPDSPANPIVQLGERTNRSRHNFSMLIAWADRRSH